MKMVSKPARRLAPELQERPRVPFRLRHLLALVVFGLFANWVWPRGYAAWQLHNLAVVYADYALCMVGPTGPKLLKSEPRSFVEVARRRLVTSMPDEQPFVDCQGFVEQMDVDHATYRLHSTHASDFVEYKNTPFDSGRTTLSNLDLSLEKLHQLAEDAWPFVRSGATKLMKASSYAQEAPHVPVVPPPGKGSGLPASRWLYRSTVAYGDTVVVALGSGANARMLISKNRGADWVRGGRRLASDLRDRCVADDEGRAFTLSRMNDGDRIVLSQGPGAPPQVATLGSADEEIAGVACDEEAMVAALARPVDQTGHRPIRLRLCPFRRPCRDLSPPSLGLDKLYYPADVARIGGDTIVSRTSGGITRVASSRDDGRSWTPWVVAYDHTALSSPTGSPPFRLLAIADDLLLYTGGRPGEAYPLLVSTDHGASFHAPEAREVTDVGPKQAVADAR